VTVETDDGESVASTRSTRRRLFPSSSPFPAAARRAAAATTTTTIVPLKESIEEEDGTERLDPAATPKRRGRPRKTNGTPIPSALKKRKAGTPIKQRTLRRQNTSHLPDPLSDPAVQPSPTPRRRGRPPKNSSVEPPSDAGLSSAAKAPRSQAGRRRRQALAPEEIRDIAEEPELPVSEPAVPDEDEMDLVGVSNSVQGDSGDGREPSPSLPREADSDIWMATASQDATPRAQSIMSRPTAQLLPLENTHRSPSADLDSLASDADDYAADAPSVGGDLESDPLVEAGPERRDDTIAQGEDFSMIFMDSIQSFQAFKSSMQSATHEPPPVPEEDFGEETSIIINKTLESVRRGNAAEMEQGDQTQHEIEDPADLGDLEDADETHDEPEELSPVQDLAEEDDMEATDERPADIIQEQDQQGEEEEEDHHEDEQGPESTPAVPLGRAGEQDAIPSDETTPVISPVISSTKFLSSRWLRSPRKADVSPLRQRLVQSQFRQADVDAGTTPMSVDGASSPLVTSSAGRRASGALAEPEYEDSFSEIPQDVLTAATPRRPAARVEPTAETDDEDMGDESDAEAEQMQVSETGNEVEDSEEVEPESEPAGDSSHQTAASNTSSAARTDHGRLPTPDDTPPNIEDQTEESPEKSSAVSASMASSPPEPEAQLEAEEEALSSVAEQAEPEEANTQAITRATPLNQVSSPAQEPQSVGEEPVQRSVLEKVARPALSAIVRAGRALQTITSDPPSPENRQQQLRSPFRSSASKDSGGSGSGSRDAPSAGRRISLSPARQPPVRYHRQTASLDRLDGEDPFGSVSRGRGQPSFIEALNRSVQEIARSRASSQGSAASSMRVTPPNEEMSWIANEGPIGPELRGDNSLQDVARGSTTAASVGKGSNNNQLRAAEEEVAEETNAESNRGDDETDIWEVEAERSHLQSSTQQALPADPPAPLHQRGHIPSPWMRSTTNRPSGSNAPLGTSPAPEFEEYSLLEQRRKEQENQASRSGEKANRFDLSSFFSSPNAIPGGPSRGSLTNPAPTAPGVANEPAAAKPGPSIQTSSMFPSVPQKEFRPRRNSRSSQFSPAKPKQAPPPPPVDQSASPETPERLQMPVVSQKQDFTPRQRQTNASFRPASGTSVAPTPPRMQLSRADIQRWQQETSNASDKSPGRLRPLLRPLPPRDASPTKSNLRSPLKPHTPGRVVEFASSVLSPAEQARLRSERRSSVVSGLEAHDAGSSTQAPPLGDHDKENQDSDISMTDASPVTDPDMAKQTPLSQTVWSRRHWALLENIIQYRRERAFDFDFPRRADRYLGKTVRDSNSGGAAMVLERWHLDCVDAFRDIVGGWNEGVLAMRLFSLIMAAERRNRPRKAKEQRQRQGGVMFH
jgi:serine/arginine repetitive matrix protein 2